MIPIAASVTLAERVIVSLRRTRARTHRREVHKAWECNDPIVHGIYDVTTVQLEEQPKSGIHATRFEGEPTKRPSANHWFKGYIMLVTTRIAFV